jgi:hypothetical protein
MWSRSKRPPVVLARRPRRGIVRRLLRGVMVALLLIAIPPAIFIGAKCYRGSVSTPSVSTADIAGYQRPEVFTYLTLPERYIVYSAEEYAGLVAQRSPADFPYLGAISQYWAFYGAACEATRSAYPFDAGYHLMLGVIGAGFTVEHAIKGVYENTAGRLTAWWAGRDTPEDAFAAKTAAEYGAFMHTLPWYEFPFGARLRSLWRDVPLWGPRPVRKLERRSALTIEYAVKGAYGWLIGLVSRSVDGAEDPKIHARIEGATDAILRDARVERVRATGGGAYIVRLPRHEAFTKTALALLDSGVRFVDVAGNDDMLVTVVAPAAFDERGIRGAGAVASRPILTDPRRKRVALLAPVARLHEVVRALRAAGATIERLHDY